MIKQIFFIGFSFLFYGPLLAGEGEYAVSKIPAALLKNTNAIKRMEKISFEIVNTGEAILKKKYAITIMNENGDRQAGFVEYYDKLHEIKNIEGTLYDAGGKELKRLKNRQIIDATGMDDNNLVDDNRRKFHHFFHKVYPYTIEYEVEIKYNGTLFFPLWLPREDENFSVEQSNISIIFPADYVVRYKAFNYKGEPVTTVMEKNRKMITWEAKELPAMEDEYASPNWFDMNIAVLFGPTAFEIEKYKGNMNSWQDFGKFVYSLKEGRDQLPDNIKQIVHQVAGNITDPKEKIAKLYEYMQHNTRYISIQLGIGGWQPFDAKYVASKSYGDCKALSNYMYSILKEAGINSFYTLIKAGRNASEVIPDFPAQQFNHVILCVPLQKDTVWLECTSQTLPSGYLGEFTGNRYALLVDENGGHLVRTPLYGLNENLQLRKIKAVLNTEGTLDVNAATHYAGLQQDNIHGLINNLSKDKVKEYLHEQLDFATYEISKFTYKEEKSSLPAIDEVLDITVSSYATITGKRLFIVPNVMTRNSRKLPADEERKYDMVFTIDYRDVDSVEISLPEGYDPESVPRDISLNTKFGKYSSSVKLSGSKLFYYRSIERYAGRFPAKDYGELVKFYEATYKADRNKVVLVKNEGTKGF
jgi:transglutaminase-like putative cysteine protease